MKVFGLVCMLIVAMILIIVSTIDDFRHHYAEATYHLLLSFVNIWVISKVAD